MLARMLSAASAGALKNFQFVTSATASGTTSTQTFSGVSIGAAATNRRFIVGFTCGNSRTVSSATLGGASMTKIGTVSSFGETAFFEISYPTGTTADIVVNLSGSLTVASFIAVYSFEKASAATVVSSESGSVLDQTKSVTLNTFFGGAVLLAANQYNSTGGVATVSSISGLDATDASSSTTVNIRTFNSDLVTPTATGVTYSITFSKAGNSVDKYLGIAIA